jgi:hypothetical protein
MFSAETGGMDWGKAVARHREALLGVVATLLALLGLEKGEGPWRISRALHRAAFRTLIPAESAARRLIAVLAKDVAVKLRPARPLPPGLKIAGKTGARLSFRLSDPPHRLRLGPFRPVPRAIPRIHVITPDPRIAALWAAPAPEAAASAEVRADATRLSRRLAALKSALDDLPHQARRLARLRAKRERFPERPAAPVLRLGPPPGHRKVPRYDVDLILRETHELACRALPADTS